MAKKTKVQPIYNTYRVISQRVGKSLGPYKVMEQGNERIVMLTDKQAKYYLDQEVIENV